MSGLSSPKLVYKHFALPFICLVIFAGCNFENGGEVSANSSATTPPTKLNESETTSVSVATGENVESPAAAADKLPEPGETADAICRMFVEYLASGNRAMAEQLLTPSALSVTSRAKLQLEPVAGPGADYSLMKPRFATNKKKVCQVDCQISEVIDGNQVETEITWMCRRQKKGWRIAGMLVSMAPGNPKDFLSFENVQDVMRIQGSLVEDLEIREADASDPNRFK